MMLQKIPFRSTHAFTEFFQKYIEQHPSLKSYYNHFPSLENFGKQIKEKAASFSKAKRKVLVDALHRQYQTLKPIGAVETNIQSLLQENTFTVATGHQLSIFTGPLYFIYKIVTVIRTCQELTKKYPKSHFVPVYWMASEDHDYEEIKSFRLYGKKYTWETVQQGAVGRFQTKDIKQLFDQLPGEVGIFREAYLKSGSLSEAVRKYVHALFASEGLIVMEADDKDFKTLFQKVMSDDLFEHTPFKLVTETNKELETWECDLDFFGDAATRRHGDTAKKPDESPRLLVSSSPRLLFRLRLICRNHFQILELLGINTGRGIGEGTAGLLGFGEGDYVADGFFACEEHD